MNGARTCPCCGGHVGVQNPDVVCQSCRDVIRETGPPHPELWL